MLWILFGVNGRKFYVWGKVPVGFAGPIHTLPENISQKKKLYLYIYE